VDEVELQGAPYRPIMRVDDTVRRPPGWWTPAVHDLLRCIALTGFDCAPRPLGYDEHGREVLSYIEGDSGREAIARLASDDGLTVFARLLRSYHDAVAGYRPPETAEWAYGVMPMGPSDIVCHGDFGAWNVVWRGTQPVGLLDWDLAYPGPALDDIAYALAYSVPFRDDDYVPRWLALTTPPQRAHRIEVFAAAYGIATDGLVDAVIARQWKYVDQIRYLHDRGLDLPWTTTASIAMSEERAEWSEANRGLFT
jgi:hypothetical protein